MSGWIIMIKKNYFDKVNDIASQNKDIRLNMQMD